MFCKSSPRLEQKSSRSEKSMVYFPSEIYHVFTSFLFAAVPGGDESCDGSSTAS